MYFVFLRLEAEIEEINQRVHRLRERLDEMIEQDFENDINGVQDEKLTEQIGRIRVSQNSLEEKAQ